MKCPLFGRQGWNHAREHGDLSEDRGGGGYEFTRSSVTSHDWEDQVVAGGGVDRRQGAADATLAEAVGGARPEGITGPAARYTESPSHSERASRGGSEPLPGHVLRSEREAFS